VASIPLGSAEIRLGQHFNQQFYYGDSDTTQLQMNSEMMRDYSIGAIAYGSSSGSWTTDPVPYTSGAQRNLGMYRGGCGRYPDVDTTSLTLADNSQDYAWESGSGPSSKNSWVKVSNPNMIGTGVADSSGSNLVAQYVNGGNAPTNTATNIVADFGYLEPGTYNVAFEGASYNTGTHYCVVRGYTGEHLSGSSSNYKVISKACYWAGGWDNSHLGTLGSSFTINSTYPYVIMSLETHHNQNYYINTIVSRKDTTSSYMNATYKVNPNIWRVS